MAAACSSLSQRGQFIRIKHATTDQKTPLPAIVQAEHSAASGDSIQNQLCMAPHLKLRTADINGRSVDLSKKHVAVANFEIANRVAHRARPVATSTRLMEQHRPMVRDYGGQ